MQEEFNISKQKVNDLQSELYNNSINPIKYNEIKNQLKECQSILK